MPHQDCLLIGGPADGTWKNINTDMPVIQVHEWPKISLLAAPVTATSQASIRSFLYKRQHIYYGSDEDFLTLYVVQDMPMREAFESLFRWYKRRDNRKPPFQDEGKR